MHQHIQTDTLIIVFLSVHSSQTHPNVDKKLFTAESVIGLKNPEKSFPLNNDVGVLKWRLQTTDEALIPLTSKQSRFDVMLPLDNESFVVYSSSAASVQ